MLLSMSTSTRVQRTSSSWAQNISTNLSVVQCVTLDRVLLFSLFNDWRGMKVINSVSNDGKF